MHPSHHAVYIHCHSFSLDSNLWHCWGNHKRYAALRSVGRSRDVTTSSGPVDVNVLALWVLLAGKLLLDPECVGTKVVTLGLEQVGWQILGPVAVVKGQSSAKCRCWDTPEGALADNVPPASLRVVDGLVEKVVEEQVLEVRVRAVCLGNVLQEDGTDDASSAPHEGDFWLIELPRVLLGSLEMVSK